MTASTPPDRIPDGRAVVVYSVARAVVFAGCMLLCWLAGFDGLVLVAAALLLSGVLSWFLLRPQRLAMSGVVERRVDRVRQRIAARTAAEDAYADQLEQHTPVDR